MSSALAAFAQARHEDALTPPVDEIDEDAYASDNEPKSERVLVVATPSALAQVALMEQAPVKKKTVTLLDVAKDSPLQQQPTLLDVAQSQDAKNFHATGSQLSAIAAEVQAEEHQAAQRRTQQIDRELVVTSKQVQHELLHQRHSQVAQVLREVAQEEPAAYGQQGDEFEADDPAVERAAERVVEATTGRPNQKPTVGTMSVDRHLLKQRQQRHGLNAKETQSTSKAKTMKEKLSSFQFQLLSLTQQRVFLAMLVDDKPSEGSIKRRCNMHAIEELAKDRATQLRQKHKLLKTRPPKHAKLDDSRHCRFTPKIKNVETSSRSRDDEDDEDGSGGNQRREDFIRRMEATERVRTEQLRRTRAEGEYNARVDKKECPQCGNPQSYAELTQKRKKCPNCGVSYKSRLAWSDIADEFLARMASHLKTEPAQDNQLSEQEPRSGSRRWGAVRDEFLGRVQRDLLQRNMTKELILQQLEAECTFAPQISERAKRLQLADFDERLRRDLENRRMRQEQYRVLSAATATAEQSPSMGRRDKPAAGGRLPRAFEERLKKDLEQRRERMAGNENPKQRLPHQSGSSGRSRGLY